jgi:hypothetical protein
VKPRTKSLFHFTNALQTLCRILEDGFWPRYCHEYIGWVATDPEFIAIPVVCFCDIPLSRLTEHTAFYGNFGIGMTQEWGLNSGLNPVFYISKDLTLFPPLKGLFNNPHPKVDDSKFWVMQTLGYTKPLVGSLGVGALGSNLQNSIDEPWGQTFKIRLTIISNWIEYGHGETTKSRV